jgi:glycosyltransferase involved in cell wall biosynthesis
MLPLVSANWSVRASLRARRALERALSERRHDALFFHTQVTSLFSISLMRRYPSIVSLDATPVGYDSMGAAYGHRPAGTGFVDRRKHAMNRGAFGAARRLVAWSDWARDSLVNDYGAEPAKIHVIAPGASRAFFEIGQRRGHAAPEPGRPVRVLFVGGDFARKGGPALLEVIKSDLGAACELHVVTQQHLEPTPNVFVHRAAQNSPELLRHFERADIFVLPSLGDCLALVLMEAAAAGLPIITTSVGALGEAVLHRTSGLIVPPSDAAALRTALSTLVGDPTGRAAMGRASHALARRKFDAVRNNAAILHLLAEISHQSDLPRKAA